ncbi:divalent metal cation transporter [Amycolatopsis sp. K13G38]|uniref:Divalent metal cation transporter n=1 Tax=Amycolatopsis acididurans TaxID=2724524 RepID=A0ABX1JJC7_9PSEU|nr:NRAMP family divalent metal transporter [Amycolatopsis acididurans]NKQ58555.1 divalent metal cation transporter [Amycolatopsis acididurans]
MSEPTPARPRAGAKGSAPRRDSAERLPRPVAAKGGAVLDSAHVGDIKGALGSVRLEDSDQQRTLKRRLVTFLAIMGPGLIVMVGDNDAGGISTYAQAGQNYGYSLLWTLLLLIPVLIVNQEMVVRLGAVTGVGHARLINERFGRFWGWFSVGDLFLLNFLTIVTEFIGVSLALSYFGVSKYVSVPVTAVVLVVITASGSFRRWERAMFAFIAASLLIIPLTILSHPHWNEVGVHFFVPGVQGGVSSDAVLLIIAIVGTTVAPWQLFFQQSNIIDKRITPRFIKYERADTVVGSLVVVLGAAALMVVADFAVRGTTLIGQFTDALGVADALSQHAYVLGALFAIVLFVASIIGAAAVTLATSYAFGDMFNLRHSLHRSFSDAKAFYGSYAALVLLAAAIVLIPNAPLGLITTSVQALAGLLLPSASVFLLLLCNDPEVLGPWINPRWLNIVASVIIAVLLMLSGVLVATTLFPSVNTTQVTIWLAGVLLIGLVAVGVGLHIARRRRGEPASPQAVPSQEERLHWRMPPLALLKPVTWSPGIKLGMSLLRGYLVIAAILLIVKAIQLSTG